mgnify:CR=1 FL=1
MRSDELTTLSREHSSAWVLRNLGLAAVFDSQAFDRAVFPPVFVDHWQRTSCAVNFSSALEACMDNHTQAKWCHNMPEVSFINFLEHTYPLRASEAPSWPDSRSRSDERRRLMIFLPVWYRAAGRALATHELDAVLPCAFVVPAVLGRKAQMARTPTSSQQSC